MTEMQSHREELRQGVESLKDKANMLATCHSVLSDRYSRYNTLLVSAILVSSTFSVGTAFISEQFVKDTVGIQPNTLKWITGLSAILTFLVGLLLSQWGLADKAADHRAAVRHYFAILNRCRYLLDNDAELTGESLEDLRQKYGSTEGLPKIPDSEFLKLKQHHLRKVAISRELEKTPHTSLDEIQKRLREQEGQAQTNGIQSVDSDAD